MGSAAPAELDPTEAYQHALDKEAANADPCDCKCYRETRGWANAMWCVMTLGLGYFVPAALDTHHFCPQCGKHVALAKLM